MSSRKLVIHESEGAAAPDICGLAIELINPESSGCKKVSFAKLIIRAKEESRRHFHKKTEEIYYILSGIGKIIIEDQAYDVGPGHSILLPIKFRHQIQNTGEADLIFVCADAPPFDSGDVYEI